jgi:NAD-dependent DNA ligase
MKPDVRLPDEILIKTVESEKTEKPIKNIPKEIEKQKTTDIKELVKIPGIGSSIVKKFEKAGVKSLEELFKMSSDDISSLDGIGGKTADNIIKKLGKIIKEDGILDALVIQL